MEFKRYNILNYLKYIMDHFDGVVIPEYYVPVIHTYTNITNLSSLLSKVMKLL